MFLGLGRRFGEAGSDQNEQREESEGTHGAAMISRSWELKIERRNPAWFETDIDLPKLPEGADHET